MQIFLAQIASNAMELEKNLQKILACYEEAVQQEADLIVFPELSLSGYLLKDLIYSEQYLTKIEENIARIAYKTEGNKCQILLGAPLKVVGYVVNAMLLLGSGRVLAKKYKPWAKGCYQSDVETKYTPFLFEVNHVAVEALFYEEVLQLKKRPENAQLLVVMTASYFDDVRQRATLEVLQSVTMSTGLPVLYLNRVGAEEQLVFDGGSCCVANGESHSNYWQEKILKLHYDNGLITSRDDATALHFISAEHLYQALMSGLRSYLECHAFQAVVLGLSGGIDSAFVAVLAADVLGSQSVRCISMPSQYSSESSISDARLLVQNLGCGFDIIPISDLFLSILSSLSSVFRGMSADVTEENVQARIRGLLLMAVANKTQALLLATGNKSESAVGYATLYGDMCGGFAPITDVYKSTLYELACWRNAHIPFGSKCQVTDLIPQSIIVKAPSAELAPGQKDEDTLPIYDILDKILYGLIERNASVEEVAALENLGVDLVADVNLKLRKSEFKRSQAALGTKVSTKMLSFDRRYPIA